MLRKPIKFPLLMSPKPDFLKFWVKEDYQINQLLSKPKNSLKLQKEESKLSEELVC